MRILLAFNFLLFIVLPISVVSCAYNFHNDPNIPMKNGAVVKSKVDGAIGVVINGASLAYPEYRTVRFSNKNTEESNRYFTVQCYVWELEEVKQ